MTLPFIPVLTAAEQYTMYTIKVTIVIKTLSPLSPPPPPIPSILKVDLLRVRPQRLLEDPGVVALLEHVQVDASLVLEPDSLCVRVSVERVHQDEGNVAPVLLIHILQ